MGLRFLLLIAFFIVSLQGASAQAEPMLPGSPVEEVYLAKDDGSGKAGEPVLEFKVTDIPIYCVVMLESTSSSVVKMNFVAMAVAGVKPETKIVTASYTTREGQNRVNFTGRPEGIWTAGKYRVDLYVNNELVTNVEFYIKGNSKSIGAKFAKTASPPKPKPSNRPTKP
ncbi:hypothetical protein BH20ACI2_BH20ACI2_13270 [soil metagenome]